MPISRKDLADAGSPEALVKRILQAEPNLSVPVPIQEPWVCVSILRIEDLDTDEFEGGLVTDAKRSEGTILAKRGGEPRRRFSNRYERRVNIHLASTAFVYALIPRPVQTDVLKAIKKPPEELFMIRK